MGCRAVEVHARRRLRRGHGQRQRPPALAPFPARFRCRGPARHSARAAERPRPGGSHRPGTGHQLRRTFRCRLEARAHQQRLHGARAAVPHRSAQLGTATRLSIVALPGERRGRRRFDSGGRLPRCRDAALAGAGGFPTTKPVPHRFSFRGQGVGHSLPRPHHRPGRGRYGDRGTVQFRGDGRDRRPGGPDGRALPRAPRLRRSDSQSGIGMSLSPAAGRAIGVRQPPGAARARRVRSLDRPAAPAGLLCGPGPVAESYSRPGAICAAAIRAKPIS